MLVFHVNDFQRVTSAEEYFNNQVDRMAHSVDVSEPLSQPPLSSLNGLVNRVAMVAKMEVTGGLSNVDFHSPRSA